MTHQLVILPDGLVVWGVPHDQARHDLITALREVSDPAAFGPVVIVAEGGIEVTDTRLSETAPGRVRTLMADTRDDLLALWREVKP